MAGAIGDPTASGKAPSFNQLGFEYNSVERDMKVEESRFGGDASSERLLLQGLYGVTPFTDLSLRIGMADLETSRRGFNGDPGIAFGGGARWTLFQTGDLRVGIGFQFLQFFSRDGGSQTPRVTWTELESFFGGSFQGMERFTPYFGIAFSKAQGKLKGGSTIRSDDLVGLFVGAEFLIFQNYYLMTEARIIDENALMLRLNYHL